MSILPFRGMLPTVHPSAFVHPSVELLGDVHIGELASLWPTTVLRGDSGTIRIGARTSIQDGSVVHATTGMSKTTIGADCTVGHRVILHGCTVGNSVLVGMGSILLDNCEIGDWSLIGAGSLITAGKQYPARSFILGSPAKRIRDVTEKEIEWIKRSTEMYLDLAAGYRL